MAKTYHHGSYEAFLICDPKLRQIHKAGVRDRVLHHAIFRILYQIFDRRFIHDSYSCRVGKGTHAAVNRLERFTRSLSQHDRLQIFALKCDIKKFFDSIDQDILLRFIQRLITDENTRWLIEVIIRSFEKLPRKGLPLGNVTSQLFANIYLNELDQFVKHRLGVRHYLRYCDDFIILGNDRADLLPLVEAIDTFLGNHLRLNLHRDKITIRTYRQGIDFLGYVVRPYHRVLRTRTKRRILRRMGERRAALGRGELMPAEVASSLQSYLGILKHCKGSQIARQLRSEEA